MDKLLLTYQEVESASSKFKETQSNIDGLISKLEGIVQNVAGGWVGDSYDAFNSEFGNVKPKLQEFSTLCETMSQKLTTAHNNMQEADATAKGMFNL